MTEGRGIRFRRDLPEFRSGQRYVSDGEGQPFPWKTRWTEAEVSFDLPPERCSLSVLVERSARRHPIWLTADAGGDRYGPKGAGSYSLAAELIGSKFARLTSQMRRYRRSGFRPQRALDDVVGAAVAASERARELTRKGSSCVAPALRCSR